MSKKKKNNNHGKKKKKKSGPNMNQQESQNKQRKVGSDDGDYVDDYHFRHSLEADGSKVIVEMNADGNCLFRSLSDQLYQDHGSHHDRVRSEICDFIQDHKEDFQGFLILDDDEDDEEDARDFPTYIANMREDGEWGGNMELVAAARLYGRNITVFSAALAAFTIHHGAEKSNGPDLLLSYHDNDHYNSVRGSASPSTKADEAPRDDEPGQTTKKKANKNQVRKNEPCPCGSGLRYKKCCWAKEKHAARVRELRNTSDEEEKIKQEDASKEMNGKFRVLKI